VNAALGLLAEGGLEAVSFRRIAKALGWPGRRCTGTSRTSASSWTLMAEELLRRTGRAYAGPDPGQRGGSGSGTTPGACSTRSSPPADAPRVLAGNRPSPESYPHIERVLAVLVEAGMSPGRRSRRCSPSART
jgi:TetR/AcrR family tetracycline transcriptional repressor